MSKNIYESSDGIKLTAAGTLIDGKYYATLVPDNGEEPAVNKNASFDSEQEAIEWADNFLVKLKLLGLL